MNTMLVYVLPLLKMVKAVIVSQYKRRLTYVSCSPGLSMQSMDPS